MRGPCMLKLTREQWARRVSVLGPVPDRMKRIQLDGGQMLAFKYGETFEIGEFEGKLNPAIFERTDVEEEAQGGGSDAPDTDAPDPTDGTDPNDDQAELPS